MADRARIEKVGRSLGAGPRRPGRRHQHRAQPHPVIHARYGLLFISQGQPDQARGRLVGPVGGPAVPKRQTRAVEPGFHLGNSARQLNWPHFARNDRTGQAGAAILRGPTYKPPTLSGSIALVRHSRYGAAPRRSRPGRQPWLGQQTRQAPRAGQDRAPYRTPATLGATTANVPAPLGKHPRGELLASARVM
jgi:hypothetical protein